MRRGSLLWIWPIVACTAETGGLEAQPGDDAGVLGPDASGSVDASPSDLGAPPDLGVPSDAGLPLDACPAWVDQIAGAGAITTQTPLLLRDGQSILLAWTTTTGIEVATLSPTLVPQARQRLGGPQASDVHLLTYDGRPHLVWVENSSTANQLFDAELNGRIVQRLLDGGGRRRISAAIGTMGELLVVDTNGVDTHIYQLEPQLLEFSEGRLHFDVPVYESGDSGPPIALYGGGSGRAFLAWLSTGGIYGAELFDAVVLALGPPLVDPNNSSFIAGFQVLEWPHTNTGSDELRLLTNDFGDRRASVHLSNPYAPTNHTLVQRYAGGIVEYSSTGIWVPELSSFVVAWPDFREAFAAEGYYGRRRIYGTRLTGDGAFVFTDAQGGHPDLPLSPPLTRDALRPSLLSLGGDRLLLAYLTDDGAVHLSSGSLSCLEPVADLAP